MKKQIFLTAGTSVLVALSMSLPALAAEDTTTEDTKPSTQREIRTNKLREVLPPLQDRVEKRRQKIEEKFQTEGDTKTTRSRANSDKAATPPSNATTIDTACVSEAVDVRDSAIIAALSTMSSTLTDALSTRKNSLMTAWTGDAASRTSALRTAWDLYKTTAKEARAAFATSRREIWSTFKTTAQGCKAAGTDSSGQSSDNAL